MKEEHRSNPPQKQPAKTGLTLGLLVGGLLILIMILGWIYVSTRSGGPN